MAHLSKEDAKHVRETEKYVRRYGSNAQRFINAGHKIVHRGCNEFRCVVCGKASSSDSDIAALDLRCEKAKG